MKRFLLTLPLMAAIATTGELSVSAQTAETSAESTAEPTACPAVENAQNYDVIVFGDEVPGVMTALKLQQTLAANGQSDQVALITEGDTDRAIGGHLVRGGLAYLDRNQVPQELRSQYGIFGTPSRLYQEFLRLGQVDVIGLDRFIIADSFEQALSQAGIEVIGNVDLGAVQTAGSLVCSFSAGNETYAAKQFVDASQSGELAAASDVDMMQGLEALGFPDSTLSIGLVLDFFGVPIEALKAAEADVIGRLLDANDAEAQGWLDVASGGDTAKRQDLLNSLLDNARNPKLLYQGTPDSADVRSLAFSIAVHGQLGQEYNLKTSGFLFDRANIAILNDRLSFNALLFYANAADARALSVAGGQPSAEMLAVANEIKALFERLGVPQVEIQEELYIRNAGQIANPVDELSATLMTAGGVPEAEALGTFGYHLDDRGGIDGLDEEVNNSAIRLLDLRQMPVFNYGFRHTLPQERENLAVLGPASGFGGLGTTAGRIVEFNVSVGEGLAVAMAKAIQENRSLQTITNREVRQALGYDPAVYGYRTGSFRAVSTLEQRFRTVDYERDYLNQAQVFLEEGDYGEASRELSRAITLEPENADAYYLRGNALLNLQVFDLALADFDEAIRLDPQLTAAYLHRGYLNTFNNNFNQGLADFEQALRLDANNADAKFGQALANSFDQSAQTGETWSAIALPWLNETIAQQPEFATAYIIRGLAQAEADDPEKARADIMKAIELQQAQGDPLAASETQRTLDALMN
ncbi:MAG: tetratricopeptide repeat protein [Cyanobacteria bacterium J06634_6]